MRIIAYFLANNKCLASNFSNVEKLRIDFYSFVDCRNMESWSSFCSLALSSSGGWGLSHCFQSFGPLKYNRRHDLQGTVSWCGFPAFRDCVFEDLISPPCLLSPSSSPHKTPCSALFSLSLCTCLCLSQNTTFSSDNRPSPMMVSTWALCFTHVSTLSPFKIKLDSQSPFYT